MTSWMHRHRWIANGVIRPSELPTAWLAPDAGGVKADSPGCEATPGYEVPYDGPTPAGVEDEVQLRFACRQSAR